MGVARSYGPVMRIDGEELIPVALVSFGYGGGSSGTGPGAAAQGTGPGADPGAAGGGGGGIMLPLGVYGRGRSGRVEFRPNTVAVLAGLTPLVSALGFAVRGVIRTLRR